MLHRSQFLSIAAPSVLILAACANDPVAPTAVFSTALAGNIVATTSSMPSGTSVPLRGMVAATESGTFDPVTGRVTIRLDGTGTATHLGRYSLVSLIDLEPVTAIATGVITLVAADGSTLRATFDGVGIRQPNDIVDITETATITGGTGRFAAARGQFTLTRRLDQTTGESRGRFDGVVEIGS